MEQLQQDLVFYKNKCEMLEEELQLKNKIIQQQKLEFTSFMKIYEEKVETLVKTVSFLST